MEGEGARLTPKGLIRTLLLQPRRPSYSQAITLGSPSAGAARPLAAARYCSTSWRFAGDNREELVNYRPSLTQNDGPVNEVTAPVNRDVLIITEARTNTNAMF